MRSHLLAGALLAGALGACSSASSGSDGAPASSDPVAAPPAGDPFDVPIDGLGHDHVQAFLHGDDLFDLPFRENDGLGPLYVRIACSACHQEAARGPGLVQKMSVVEADGITAAADQSALPFGHTVRPLLAAGATHPIAAPDDPHVKVSVRVGPPVLGRGYMEAVDDAEIERVAAEQALRKDGIHGRINHVAYTSEANPRAGAAHVKGDRVIGRFGLKARIATLDDFTADALQGDMGLTSPMRPNELPNPDGLTDDKKPGIDVSLDLVNGIADYMRLIAIPRRADVAGGAALFEAAKCSACHVPSLRTRPDFPIPQLAAIDAPVYTDFLLHDLGDALADGMVDGEAGSRDWRTAPLIGLRFNRTFLHDGRAHTIREAIEMHDAKGSEASESVGLFRALAPADQTTLLAFVSAL